MTPYCAALFTFTVFGGSAGGPRGYACGYSRPQWGHENQTPHIDHLRDTRQDCPVSGWDQGAYNDHMYMSEPCKMSPAEWAAQFHPEPGFEPAARVSEPAIATVTPLPLPEPAPIPAAVAGGIAA